VSVWSTPMDGNGGLIPTFSHRATLPYSIGRVSPNIMAKLLTTHLLCRTRGEGRASGKKLDLPFLVVLSCWENGAYRLEPLEAWLSRHACGRKKRFLPKLSTLGDNS
jgi:hypothetical protein